MQAPNLSGKTALITGASSGLGAEFARQLATQGCNLILVARRSERMETLKQEILNHHDCKVSIITQDLALPEGPGNVCRRIQASGLTVDILINNAGFGIFGSFLEVEWERHRDLITVNITALVELTRRLLPGMTERRQGWILFVSSIGAFQPTPLYVCYSATKSFVQSFGEALNYELRDQGVTCTVVAPGPVATEFLAVAGQNPSPVQKLFMMSSEKVVATALNALFRGKPSVVPGVLNKLTAFVTHLFPRRLTTWGAYQFVKSEACP
jgi:hypothetical protein